MRYFLGISLIFCSFHMSFLEAKAAPQITATSLSEINQATYSYIEHSTLTPLAKLLFYAYLAEAQKDFVWKSHEVHHAFVGELAPLNSGMVRLFKEGALISELEEKEPDETSLAISEKIVEKYRERLLKEAKQIKNYPLSKEPGVWTPTSQEGYYGLNFGKVAPWYLTSCSQFRCTPPTLTKEALLRELNGVKTEMKQLDIKKLSAIDFWNNQSNWEILADNYMKKHQVPLEVRVNVRAVLLSTLLDATAAAFDAKYTYWMPQPELLDRSIFPVIKAPSYPSYPSKLSTTSRAAAVVLGSFFPQDQKYFDLQAEEAGMSQVWAGIHYPMDHLEGKKLGDAVARHALSQIQSRSPQAMR